MGKMNAEGEKGSNIAEYATFSTFWTGFFAFVFGGIGFALTGRTALLQASLILMAASALPVAVRDIAA